MSIFESVSHPISSRLREGLERVGAVLRSESWTATTALGLNPTQANILTFLAGRNAEAIRVKDIALQLGVSQPTATDSITALERKNLVQKVLSADDARSVRVKITGQGRKMLKTIGMSAWVTEESLAALAPDEQADFLLLLIKLIRSLQLKGAVPVQRMCVSCKHFRPNTYSDALNPHHCAFVNAAFGDRHLRLDCSDHETADPAAQAATWAAFNKGSSILQATNSE
jgi:DNA-binding MarR family transcriptional regulator